MVIVVVFCKVIGGIVYEIIFYMNILFFFSIIFLLFNIVLMVNELFCFMEILCCGGEFDGVCVLSFEMLCGVVMECWCL